MGAQSCDYYSVFVGRRSFSRHGKRAVNFALDEGGHYPVNTVTSNIERFGVAVRSEFAVDDVLLHEELRSFSRRVPAVTSSSTCANFLSLLSDPGVSKKARLPPRPR